MKKEDLINSLGSVHMKENTKNEIINRCLNSKEEKIMFKKKKAIIIAAAAVLAIGTASFASNFSKISYSGHSTSTPDYTYIPVASECQKAVGFVPVILDTLGDFEYKDATIIDSVLTDEENGKKEDFKEFTFNYIKDDAKIGVFVYEEQYSHATQGNTETAKSVNGIDIYYNSYSNKMVPPDYEPTEEDKKREAEGNFYISYGASEIEELTIQSAYFNVDGLHYELLDTRQAVDKDTLLSMAEEIINK